MDNSLEPFETEDPLESSVEIREWVVDGLGHSMRLDRWLADQINEFSRTYVSRLISAGDVEINQIQVNTPARKLLVGQSVRVRLVPPPEATAFKPEAIDLDIRYEDEDLMVIHKPAGLVMHPAAGNWSGTLMNGLLAYHQQAKHLPRAGIVHRLDKDTSGLLVVGKTLEAVGRLSAAIAARQVQRRYMAIAHGLWRGAPSQHVDQPVGRSPTVRTKMAVNPHGRPAQTDIDCVASAMVEGRPLSCVVCRLHTGRTHQIRVHMAFLGYPLVADVTYGGRLEHGISRQALHAYELNFEHPVSGQPMSFVAPLALDLQPLWDRVHEVSNLS